MELITMSNNLSEGREKRPMTRREFLKRAGALGVTLFFGPFACSRRRDLEVPPTLTPIPEALRIKEFSLGSVDFTFDDNVSFGDRLEIRTLFESAYPLLKDFFGIEPPPMTDKERLKIHLASGEWQGGGEELLPQAKFQVGGHLSNFDQEGKRTMYLRNPGNRMTTLHEFSHLFTNFPIEYEFDPVKEGFAVAAEMIIGEKLGLIDSREGVILKYLGELYDPEPFNNEVTLPAVSYDYPPMMAIRYTTAGIAWSELYQEDPGFFKKFHQLLGEALRMKKSNISINGLIEEAFSGDFETFRQKHPILIPPKPGKKIAFAPLAKGQYLVAYCYEFNPEIGLEEIPLEGVQLELTIEIDQKKVVDKDPLRPTDNFGTVTLFTTPPHPSYINQRIPQEKKTSLMKLTVEGPIGKQEIELRIPPLELLTSSLLRTKSQIFT